MDIRKVLSRIEAALGTTSDQLHELDHEDVAFTEAGQKLVREAAATVWRQFTGARDEKLSNDRAMALFLDHVFWDARSGGLILCAEMMDRSFCLPVPREHWRLKANTGRVQ